jgi:hypothetical protein
LRTPGSASEITIDWMRTVLARERSGCEPISLEVEPDYGGPSLLGRIARVRLTYAVPGCEPHSVVVKFQASSSDWEAQIYRLLSEKQVRSVPRLFGALEFGTLVMEDLSPARSGSQLVGCSLPQVEDALSMLADIHSRFWRDPRVPSIRPGRFASAILVNMAECWEPFKNRYRELLGDTTADFEWLRCHPDAVAAHRLSEPTTLFHGDVHAENIIFRGDGRGKPVLLDWQLAGRGLAANDVSFFLVKGMTAEQRRTHEEKLLRDYFGLLPRRVLKGYSYNDFKLDYRACVTRCMISAVMLVGPRFADRPDQPALADEVAARVIAAVRDLSPVDAMRERGRA